MEIKLLKNLKIRKNIIFIIMLVIIIALSFIILNGSKIPTKNKKQIDFISNFLSSIGMTDSLDSDYNVRNQLYDKNIVNVLNDFEWYHFATVSLKKAYPVNNDETDEIKECMKYLSQTYPSNDIEIYKVLIKSTLDVDKPKTFTSDEDDIFYLTKKDGNYCLLYTQKLFEKQRIQN
ncbi:MAG: hypothetical protein Q8930_19320 [Bacillota bacterium]|nr:hypothetical protein [Bacillota bacterium]